MTPQEQARMAYSSPTGPIQSPRGTEYTAFLNVTRAIRTAALEEKGVSVALVTALQKNRQLWTLVAASVADPANELPASLRARLFYLYEFTVEHTRKVLSGQETPAALIEVNLSIMQGLVAEHTEQ